MVESIIPGEGFVDQQSPRNGVGQKNAQANERRLTPRDPERSQAYPVCTRGEWAGKAKRLNRLAMGGGQRQRLIKVLRHDPQTASRPSRVNPHNHAVAIAGAKMTR
jgi:hypothetical protein